jgi:hypothetical protein
MLEKEYYCQTCGWTTKLLISMTDASPLIFPSTGPMCPTDNVPTIAKPEDNA